MSEGQSLLAHLPEQWVGIGAVLLFLTYIIGQMVEKYERIAKVVPFGRILHRRAVSRVKPIDAMQVAKAVEDARKEWELDGNSALTMMEARLTTISAVSRQQVADIDELQDTVRAFRAWSGYDSRWHHKHEVDNADNDSHVITPHKDFFEFEKLWRSSPEEASKLT
ncbi:minor tail protein [Mycobacterium phage Steamy]|uniref:Minor tail protein n=1 Tax=Mycobacterium phage Steamy TaxID=2250309 RepID=A0A345L0K5_9CAUD|nr:minor tail protein [Mycobacterium phage Steamy]AXH48807.1 minor tail protein [Mycobacterium phage Steamy]